MMVLSNLWHKDADLPVDIIVNGTKISGLSKAGVIGEGQTFYFDNAMVFPGLINSHDHLDFNLFPQLGDRKYQNYREWAQFIHQHHRIEIDKVLAIPKSLRAQWGVYKNLLCGVTTVVNHGEPLEIRNQAINVIQPPNNLHSVAFEQRWKLKLNHPFRRKNPFVIHTGEGTDDDACREIDDLLRWNLLHKKLIGVHGISMSHRQARKFMALVWCPGSNDYMFGATADIARLKHHTSVLFGTDSALTAHWDIREQLRLARKWEYLTDEELFAAVTTTAAGIWGINHGSISPGADADIVIARRGSSGNFFNDFYALQPRDILMVICQGQIRLFDEELLPQISNALAHFTSVEVNGQIKFVSGDLPGLMRDIKVYHPSAAFPIAATKSKVYDPAC